MSALGLVLALLNSSCSTLSPQIYSDRLTESARSDGKPASPAPRELPLVIAEVENLQARYVTAVRELSQVQPAVSLALIGLSAFSFLKAITNPSTEAIATAGVLGSATYVYGSTVISKPRQLVYLAGVEALSCAIASVEPYNKGTAWLGTEVNPASGTFRERIETATLKLQALREQAALSRSLASSETIVVKASQQPANCAAKPSCSIPAAATADERQRLEAACKVAQANFDQRCKTPQASTRIEEPEPWVIALFKQADAEIAALNRVLPAAQRTATAIEQAGPLLWERAVQIQVKVGAEVLKTEPDLSSVLAAVQGMRGAAGLITGSDVFKPTSSPGSAQGEKRAATRRLSDADKLRLDALANAVEQAGQARVKLALMVAGVDGKLAATRKNLAACEVKVAGVKLAVLPDDEELHIAKGGSAVFFVSGGSGTPQGAAVAVAGAAASELKRELDPSGRVRFTYVVPSSAASNDTVRIQFTDGSGQARHDVRVVVSDATASASTGSTSLGELTRDDLSKLGLPADATDPQKVEAIKRCQAKNGFVASGEFDPRTQKAAQQGLCKAAS